MKHLLLHSLVTLLLVVDTTLSTNTRYTSDSLSTAGPLTSSTRPRRGRPPSPHSFKAVEYDKIESLTDLVKNRPHKNHIKATDKYLEAFANHADVRSINLNQVDKVQLAKDFYSLRNEKEGSNYHNKMSLTLKQYLDQVNHLDEETKKGILGYDFAQSQIRADIKRRRKLTEIDPLGMRKIVRARDYYLRTKGQRVTSGQIRIQFDSDLESLIQGHENLSAIDVVNVANSLRVKYPQERVFSPALKAFLLKKKYSKEDVVMAQGVRSMEREKFRLSIFEAKRKASRDVASTSAPSAPSLVKVGPIEQVSKPQDKKRKRVVQRVEQRNPKRRQSSHDVHEQGHAEEVIPTQTAGSEAEKQKGPCKDSNIDHLESGAWWDKEY